MSVRPPKTPAITAAPTQREATSVAAHLGTTEWAKGKATRQPPSTGKRGPTGQPPLPRVRAATSGRGTVFKAHKATVWLGALSRGEMKCQAGTDSAEWPPRRQG